MKKQTRQQNKQQICHGWSWQDYLLQTIRRARNSVWQREWENSNSKLYYIKPHIEDWESAHNSCRQYKVKLSRISIKYTGLTQHPTCRNAACGYLRLTIGHCIQDCPQWRNSKKKHNIQGDIRRLLGKDCEVEKIMRFI